MLIAGETSGDILAADLVRALRTELSRAPLVATDDYQPLQTSLEPGFFGAGGEHMARAGVRLAFDMTRHAVTGLTDVIKNSVTFWRLAQRLLRLARERQPDVLIGVDFSGFNRRIAHAVKAYTRKRRDWFHDWQPKLVQYVSPQVWASRPGRAYKMAKDYDLLLSIFPFEKEWYAKRTPGFRVVFAGHPMIDRYAGQATNTFEQSLGVLLLPGSRPGELLRHLPVMLPAWSKIEQSLPGIRAVMVIPNQGLADLARGFQIPASVELRVGGLADALTGATLAIASTGTVTMECAYFGVPTVALYKTSRATFEIGKRIVTVKYMAMPNIMAGEELFPEFIQDAATADNIAHAAVELLKSQEHRAVIRSRLKEVITRLGPPGASTRAARAILQLSS
jgi:lipid-A-disaccharide synthase